MAKIPNKKPTDLKSQVAANIRKIREAAGLSREQLAAKSKVSARYIYVLESGQRNISLDTLEAVAKALGTNVCDLICAPERPAGSRHDAIALAIEILNEQLNKPSPRKPRKK